MRLIIGLGNPGKEYDFTRHNFGKRSVTALAEAERLSFLPDVNLKASICSWETPSGKIFLAYPNTYMNLSGESILLICDYYKIDTARDLLVVLDDVALPFGTVRLKISGSTGGHNGLASVEQYVGHPKYPRLKIGVGGHINACDSINDFLKGKPLEDYVLEKVTDDELKAFPAVQEAVLKACRLWSEKTFEEAASLVNIKRNSD